MGMDLIGTGFTVNMNGKWDQEAIAAFINALPDGFDRSWDYIGVTEGWTDEECRSFLTVGAQEAQFAEEGSRMSTTYQVGDSDYYFVWTGGGSWGDDPFDGWTALTMFIEAIGVIPDLRALTPVVGGGIHLQTVKEA